MAFSKTNLPTDFFTKRSLQSTKKTGLKKEMVQKKNDMARNISKKFGQSIKKK